MDDILSCIFTHLSLGNIKSCLLTSKQFHRVASDNSHWRDLIYMTTDILPNTCKTRYKQYYILSNFLSRKTQRTINHCIDSANLHLLGKHLTYLPKEIHILTNLKNINLEKNLLSSLPNSFVSLTNLQTLTLNINRFVEFPVEIFSLTNLQFLELDNNQLSILPSNVSSLTNLRLFSLDDNKLRLLPIEITFLTNLHTLCLHDNILESLPYEITSLQHLTIDIDKTQKKFMNNIPKNIKHMFCYNPCRS